jgi:triosephosphate isomerase
MRRALMAGNWKMNKTIPEAIALLSGLKERIGDIRSADIVVCPPFTALSSAASILKGSNIELGAQDVFWKEKGAYTGEISVPMLIDVGCRYCLIGHSERRTYFGETDETVNMKVKAVLKGGLTPIMCVGETLEERRNGKTFEVVGRQVRGGLLDLAPEEIGRVVIAYEPVWAIGTGINAEPQQANEVHAFIADLLEDLAGKGISDSVRILYGGSVTPDNVISLMSEPRIDGVLVGGASLDADSFSSIVRDGVSAHLSKNRGG